MTDETPIASKGVLLSPTALKMDEIKLYETVITRPDAKAGYQPV